MNYEVRSMSCEFLDEDSKDEILMSITLYYPKTGDEVTYKRLITTNDYISIITGTYGQK